MTLGRRGFLKTVLAVLAAPAIKLKASILPGKPAPKLTLCDWGYGWGWTSNSQTYTVHSWLTRSDGLTIFLDEQVPLDALNDADNRPVYGLGGQVIQEPNVIRQRQAAWTEATSTFDRCGCSPDGKRCRDHVRYRMGFVPTEIPRDTSCFTQPCMGEDVANF